MNLSSASGQLYTEPCFAFATNNSNPQTGYFQFGIFMIPDITAPQLSVIYTNVNPNMHKYGQLSRETIGYNGYYNTYVPSYPAIIDPLTGGTMPYSTFLGSQEVTSTGPNIVCALALSDIPGGEPGIPTDSRDVNQWTLDVTITEAGEVTIAPSPTFDPLLIHGRPQGIFTLQASPTSSILVVWSSPGDAYNVNNSHLDFYMVNSGTLQPTPLLTIAQTYTAVRCINVAPNQEGSKINVYVTQTSSVTLHVVEIKDWTYTTFQSLTEGTLQFVAYNPGSSKQSSPERSDVQFDPARPIWFIQDVVNQVNKAFEKAVVEYGTAIAPPLLQFNTTNQFFNFTFDPTVYGPTASPRHYIYLNLALAEILGFPTDIDRGPISIKTELATTDIMFPLFTGYPPVVGSAQWITVYQERKTISRIINLARVLVQSNGFGLNGTLEGVNTSIQCITDTVPDLDNFILGQALIYVPYFNRWYALTQRKAINTVQVTMSYQTRDQTIHTILVPPGDFWSILLCFRRT
jgi:hypothetical protein